MKSQATSVWNRVKSWFNTARIIPIALYPIIVLGVAVYFLKYFVSFHGGEPVESPLTFATLSVAMGGFILLGAFYKEGHPEQSKSELPKMPNRISANELKRIAKLFLGSALSFVIIFLMFETLSMLPNSSPNGQCFTQVAEQVCMTIGDCLIGMVAAVAMGSAMYMTSPP